MAHHTNHRRSVASLDPKPSMDPTDKKYTNSTTTAASAAATTKLHRIIHHPRDPTIQAISKRFNKLYTNHKILKGSNASHHTHPHPHTCVDNTSRDTLTKSKSHRPRNLSPHTPKETTKTKVKVVKEAINHHDIQNPSLLKSKTHENTKKPSHNVELKNKDFHGEKLDMKINPSAFLSASYDGDEMKILPSFTSPEKNRCGGDGGGRRRSFSSSRAELTNSFSCCGVRVASADMPPFMQIHAVDCARKTYDSLEMFTAKTLAYTLKKEFDGAYGPAWHCIVGKSFGSFVTHSVGGFIYFSIDHKIYVLLFKTAVQKAE